MIRRWPISATALLAGCWVDHVPCSKDLDGDGYTTCIQPRGLLENGDCNDLDDQVHPNAEEIEGNCIDEDCNDAIGPSAELDPYLSAGGAMICARADDDASPQLGQAIASATDLDEPALVIAAPRRGGTGVIYFVDRDTLTEAAGDLVAIEDISPKEVHGATNSEAGSALALKDVDGDGTDELFVGAPGQSLEGLGSRGAVFLLTRDDWQAEASLAFKSNTECPIEGEFCMVGDANQDKNQVAPRLGTALVAGMDRVEGGTDQGAGDGEAFLLVSAPGYGTRNNQTGVGAVLLVRDFTGRQTADPANTPAIIGEESGAGFGAAISSGDLDGDGVTEAIMSANSIASPGGPSAGAIYANDVLSGDWYGGTTEDLTPLAVGGEGITGLGTVLAGGKDIDADGLGDVVASTSCPPNGADGCEYHVFVLLSATGDSSAMALETSTDIIWRDTALGSVSPATLRLDQRENNASYTTLFVGTPSYEGDSGAMWVISDLQGTLEGTIDLGADGVPVTLAAAEDGGDFAGSQLGSSITRAGWESGDQGVAMGAPLWSNSSGAVVWFAGQSLF